MRTLVCFREGRFKCHIGDTVEIPDDVDVYDHIYFREVPEPEDDSVSTEPVNLRRAKPDADTRKTEPDVDVPDDPGADVITRSEDEE